MEAVTPTQLKEDLDAGKAVFLKIWKKGCGPCKLSTPAVERIESADTHGMKFVQIAVNDHPEMLEIADTEVLPVFCIFRDKKMTGKFVGFKGIEKLKQFVDEAWA